MSKYLFILISAFSLLATPIFSKDKPVSSPMQEFRKMVRTLASDSGFTDNDALKASVYLLKILEGNGPKESRLSKTIKLSKPKSVIVFVSYDFGIGFIGYEVEFLRGDLQKGMRTASFKSISIVPSE